MKTVPNITEQQLALLSILEIQEACAKIADIILSFANPAAIGIVAWDSDFESFSELHRYAFGSQAPQMNELFAEYCSPACGWPDSKQVPFQLKKPTGSLSLPVFCYKLEEREQPVALLFVAGDGGTNCQELEPVLAQFAVTRVLANTYEVAELKREVERLREHYELLETDYTDLKRNVNEQAGNSSFRRDQSDKEKLVYEISNAVRSSLDIQVVLQTVVNKIGLAFNLSRCLVIWPMPDSPDYSVYEYCHEKVQPVQAVFYTPLGENFVQVIATKSAPLEFCHSEDHDQFDPQFLRDFGYQSGMLVPLIFRDSNIGTLFLQDCIGVREWSIDSTAIIGSLADLMAVAIANANMHEEKKKQAVTDGLTGIANRRHFNETLQKEFERARRYDKTLSLVVVDLDFLKKINDTYGHHTGDLAIKSIGAVLARSCRSVDTAARYGGEEFCLLLPDTETADAERLAERIRKRICETSIEGPGNISASLGVSTYPVHASDPDELFQAADSALYQAKEHGRNRVCTATINNQDSIGP